MYKKHLMILLLSSLAIFLSSGCADAPAETTDERLVEQDESENVDIKEDNSPSGDVSKNEELIEENPVVDDGPLSDMKVHYIDVGQSDSTLLQFSQEGQEYNLLIDAGNWNSSNVINYLNSQKITHIDIAIGTHPDADHIGQLDKVIHNFDVGEVWLSGNTSTSKTFQRLLTAIDSSGTDYYEPRMGDEFQIGSLEVEILYPKAITGKSNEESISMRLTYGDINFVFTGDAETHNENEIVSSGININAEILQLGHHGSNTSTSPTFLKAVNPDIAIACVGG
jgi:competence protein ComEC